MKLKSQLSIGIVCVFLGIILALQYKQIQSNYLDGISPFSKQADLTKELLKIREEKASLTEAASKDNAIIKNLSSSVREYEILAGMTDVIGQGIIITIDNPPSDPNSSSEYDVVNHYHEIVMIVNELNAAGAEAISINDQRIISISEIRNAGNAINVNNIPQTVPIVIKAIGKKSALDGALTGRYGKVTELRTYYQVLVDVKTMDEIIIPRYHGIIDLRYVRSVIEE